MEPSSSSLLTFENLHVTFHTEKGVVNAVNNVDFSIGRGEILGLVGESGCGKTVTGLSTLQLIPTPPGRYEGGRILYDNIDLLTLSEQEMRSIRGNRISMIFQEPMTSLNPVLTVGYQLLEVIRLHMRKKKGAARSHAVEMLSRVGLPDPHRRMREYPHQMSGGMRQRVMIAISLCCSPELIIADEPTTALDVTIQAQIMTLLEKLRQETNTSILLITHDLGVVAEVADNVVVMYAGTIIEQASCAELFDRPSHPYTRGLMNSIPQIGRPVPDNRLLQAIPGSVPSLTDLPQGCAFASRCAHRMAVCDQQFPPLTDLKNAHRVRCWLYEQ
jgi:peptide/nickel transport system ATP-binding protein/oligopeptide transport system ATP-binding protein